MDGEADLNAPPVPPPSASTENNFVRPINHDFNHSRSFTSTTSSSSSSSFSSSPRFIRHVQAAFKRHRPLGTMQSNNARPRRVLDPQRQASKNSVSNLGPTVDPRKTQEEVLGSNSIAQTVNTGPVVCETQVDASITLPSLCGTDRNTCEDGMKPFDVQRHQPRKFADYKSNETVTSLLVESQHVPMVDGQKKVQFSSGSNSGSHEIEWDVSNQPEAVTVISNDFKHQNFHSIADESLRSDQANSSFLAKRALEIQDQMHQFRIFVHGDLNHPMTQSSVVGSSCATITVVNSASVPVINSTTYGLHPSETMVSNMDIAPVGDCNGNPQHMPQENMAQPSCNSFKSITSDPLLEVEYDLAKELQGSEPKERDLRKYSSPVDDNYNKGKEVESVLSDLQSQPSLSEKPSSDVKEEPSKSVKQEKVSSGKAAARKRNYDSDLFIKVNGKLYQRLGKIGSGGSSEVHKVISSDCRIYALKKIKLKGRDYATAFGFCQEMEYLNKLKGRNNIIQLIDYEVTDKALLKEVMSGSTMSDKDARVKEDGCIYMVLEYGEIDLAHMLSQKWKEMDRTNSIIDENWLRFYWQQMLLAVNTIHEERIVHSDLKPANFLLVRGSLKLIDFGIAKAIMSDTTNIQRDSQVGTLSYMSPEAFMCNETDKKGNTIKCGRSSDIWSLGCILYQMVYGRTPFSEYKTFWAKFKVITDPNHEIVYEPVSNPWLLDLLKKCLAWDRNERWRIPQLLQHPFLVPPIPPQFSSHQDQRCHLLQLVAESCANNQKTVVLCDQLQELLSDHPRPEIVYQASISRDEQRKLLCKMSDICFQLQEHLAEYENDRI